MIKNKSNSEVIIIGGGITGLSAGYHLLKAGFSRFTIFDAAPSQNATTHSLGLLMGGQVDNFTRVVTAHGEAFATRFWRFGDQAFMATVAFLEEEGLPVWRKRRLRLVVTPEELTEVKEAVTLLHAASFPVNLLERSGSSPEWEGLSERVLALQDEGANGAVCAVQPWLRCLEEKCRGQLVRQNITAIRTTPQCVEVMTSSGETHRSEIVVLASHLGIRQFLPTLKDVFIPVVEQCHHFQITGAPPPWWKESGIVFSAFHSYEWGGTFPTNLGFGGGRFLRPLAGIGAEVASEDGRSTKYLGDQLRKTFSWIENAQAQQTLVGLDCRPCDELPVIGPMFGEERILLAGGYMGSGLTTGFFAGKCLSDLIQKGRSLALPERLHPARLRSLT